MTQHDTTLAAARDLLGRLPSDEREALVLSELEGLSPGDAARRMGVDEAQVVALLDRARGRLSALLERLDVGDITLPELLAALAAGTEPDPAGVVRIVASARPARPVRWRVALVVVAAMAVLVALFVWRARLEPVAVAPPSEPPPLPVPSPPVQVEPVQVEPVQVDPAPDPPEVVVASPEPPPVVDPPSAQPLRPAPAILRGSGSGSLGAAVELTWAGDGAVAGDLIHWTWGTLDVEVAPGQGVDLIVLTEEASARVVGTAFTVTRSEEGTALRVDRGSVVLVCREAGADGTPAGQEVRVEGGEPVARCRPGGSGYLAWVLALERQGAEPEIVSAVARAGLDRESADSEFRGELVWHDLVAVEAAAGRSAALERAEDCLARLDTCLGQDRGRQDDLRRMAARLASAERGCRAALHHLDALAPGERTAADLYGQARCLAPDEPARACELLAQARERADVAEWSDRVDELAAALGSGCAP